MRQTRGGGIAKREDAAGELDRVAGAKAIEVRVGYTVVTTDRNYRHLTE
jgi:hypothetical protein